MYIVEVEVVEKRYFQVEVDCLSEIDEKASDLAWTLDADERTIHTKSIKKKEEPT